MANKNPNPDFEHHKGAVHDVSGRGNDVVAEVNWNDHVKGKYIRLTIGDKSAVVKKDQLWGIFFMLGSLEEQDALIDPFVKQTKVTKFTKMVGITTGAMIPKGGMVNVLLEFTLNPETNQVTISKGNMRSLVRQRFG